MRHLALVGLTAALAFAPGAAVAQEADTSNTLDRVVAIVGTRAITATQVQERMFVELRGREAPKDPSVLKQFQRGALRALVDEELVIQQAMKDTLIKVTDEEITQSVDELYRNARTSLGSDEAFRRQLQETGFQTLEEWRTFTSEQQRRRFLYDRYWSILGQQQKIKDIPPTDAEVRQYFDQNKAAFAPRPEAVSFQQIVIQPKPSDSAKRVARALIDSILGEIRKGADFATAARRFTMDPASKEAGGSLNWIRRGQGLDPRFEAVAFALRPGVVSDPFETAFGFHIVQVERAQPAEVQARHILIMPVIDSVQADSARILAESIYRALKAGASFDSIQRIHHDKSQEQEAEQFPLTDLAQRAAPYSEALRDVKEGELAPLFRLESPDPSRSQWAIVKLTKRIPAGEVRFEDVKDQIRSNLSRILGRQRQIQALREATYVDIRDT